MGSSFTRFRDNGFWSRDPILEIWLRCLALHLGSDVDRLDHWLHGFRDELLFYSCGGCNGCISAPLDEFLTDDSRIETIIQASDRAIERLRAFGPTLPAAFFSALGIGRGASDLPLARLEFIHKTFNDLLEGRHDRNSPYEC